MALPAALRQPLETFLNDQPDAFKVVLSHLPTDLAQVLASPEGLLLAAISLLLVAVLVAGALGGSKRKSRSSSVLIAGPCGAGKTTLFMQLCRGGVHNGVVASMQENSGSLDLDGGRTAQLLDVPGHASFRHRLEAAAAEAAGVVFVLDAVDITPHRTEAAEMLYELLTSPGLHRTRVPLLIASNKADLEEDAHSLEFVRKTLERQLEALRKSKAAGIGKEAGSGAAAAAALGPSDKPVSLATLRNPVTLAECSAKAGQLSDVTAFIRAATK